MFYNYVAKYLLIYSPSVNGIFLEQAPAVGHSNDICLLPIVGSWEAVNRVYGNCQHLHTKRSLQCDTGVEIY